MALIFPIPAKYFVIIIGALSYFSSPGGVAHAAHLGGLIFGYLYLQGGRGGLTAEIKYRYLKWKMNRLRRKFDVLLRRPIGLGPQRTLTSYDSLPGAHHRLALEG